MNPLLSILLSTLFNSNGMGGNPLLSMLMGGMNPNMNNNRNGMNMNPNMNNNTNGMNMDNIMSMLQNMNIQGNANGNANSSGSGNSNPLMDFLMQNMNGSNNVSQGQDNSSNNVSQRQDNNSHSRRKHRH